MQKSLLLALLGIVGFTAPSSAESVVQVATRWGIVGIWQKDCNAPVSRDNDQQAFVVHDGRLFLERSYGDMHDSNPITAATITPKGELDLRITFPAFHQSRQNIHVRTKDGRDYVAQNRDVDTDEYTVRNGILVSTGEPTSRLTRCD